MAQDAVTDAIRSLYKDLESLSQKYEELMDTDIRESLHIVLNYFFVWGKGLDQLPISYGMFSLEGDQAVASVVNKFLSSVRSVPEIDKIPLGTERLALLQDPEIVTPGGCLYDEFIGHSDEPLSPDNLPDDLFQEGEYDE
ncbi:hypothetical protein [Halovibrio salipaludis]|uniref:hypothetical protein n=1 Tax=Halovibrio salipaludis TaxID=2032626 RepID=UPI00117B7453|nr:hypothetical protein [Halovibrio salipaludis]